MRSGNEGTDAGGTGAGLASLSVSVASRACSRQPCQRETTRPVRAFFDSTSRNFERLLEFLSATIRELNSPPRYWFFCSELMCKKKNCMRQGQKMNRIDRVQSIQRMAFFIFIFSVKTVLTRLSQLTNGKFGNLRGCEHKRAHRRLRGQSELEEVILVSFARCWLETNVGLPVPKLACPLLIWQN